jgi:3-oxoadipate enol-lactonase
MTLTWVLGIVLLAALLPGCLFVAWMLVKRPLEVWVWASRRMLLRAGLRKIVVQTPLGPQTAFVGGVGPVLVFLHGVTHQAGTWARVVPSLAGRYTLVIPDLAGHGESAPRTGPLPGLDVYQGLEAVISTQAQGRPVTLVGNSLGAWMAMVLAHRHPAWVERVVAVNGGALGGWNQDVNLMPRTREETRLTMAQLMDPSSPTVPGIVLDDLARRSEGSPVARMLAAGGDMDAWILTEDQIRTLRMPVRLVWGVSDQLFPMDYARRLAALLPDAELIPIERCGHIPQLEAPKRFLAALQKALVLPGEG